MKRVLIIACFICINSLVNAQVNFDSLYKAIDTVSSVKNKIDNFYFGSNDRKLSPKEFDTFKAKIISLSKSSGDPKDLAHGHLRVGWLYYYQFNYNDALLCFFEYLKIAESLKDSTIMAFAHSEIADDYLRMQNENLAKKHIYYAFAVANKERKEDQTTLNDCYNYLADVYTREHNYDSAYQFYLEQFGHTPKKVPAEKTDQLFVVCEDSVCQPTTSPKYEIAAFGWTAVESEQDFNGVKVYKLIHNPLQPK